MSERPSRNAIVAILGTPDRTEGSVDEPRWKEENGIRFNERWLYAHLREDPSGAPMRVVYWMRYDFRGTLVRNSEDAPWRPDEALAEAVKKLSSRLPKLDQSANQPIKLIVQHRPASDFIGKTDLGEMISEGSKTIAYLDLPLRPRQHED
jgi:hypothetical protein